MSIKDRIKNAFNRIFNKNKKLPKKNQATSFEKRESLKSSLEVPENIKINSEEDNRVLSKKYRSQIEKLYNFLRQKMNDNLNDEKYKKLDLFFKSLHENIISVNIENEIDALGKDEKRENIDYSNDIKRPYIKFRNDTRNKIINFFEEKSDISESEVIEKLLKENNEWTDGMKKEAIAVFGMQANRFFGGNLKKTLYSYEYNVVKNYYKYAYFFGQLSGMLYKYSEDFNENENASLQDGKMSIEMSKDGAYKIIGTYLRVCNVPENIREFIEGTNLTKNGGLTESAINALYKMNYNSEKEDNVPKNILELFNGFYDTINDKNIDIDTTIEH